MRFWAPGWLVHSAAGKDAGTPEVLTSYFCEPRTLRSHFRKALPHVFWDCLRSLVWSAARVGAT